MAVLAYTSGRNNERRNQAPAAYSEAAKQSAQAQCADLKLSAAFECIYEKVEASQDQARDQQDLTAQQQSAFAALSAAFFALLTLGVTAVGVVYVKRTLEATLKAVEQTNTATAAMVRQNELAEAAQRPWITISVQPLHVVIREAMIEIGYNFNFRNIGQSIAYDVWTKIETTYLDWQFQEAQAVQTGFEKRCRDTAKELGLTLLPQESSIETTYKNDMLRKLPWETFEHKEAACVLVCAATFYRLKPKGNFHETIRFFTIAPKNKSPGDRFVFKQVCKAYGEMLVPTTVGNNQTT